MPPKSYDTGVEGKDLWPSSSFPQKDEQIEEQKQSIEPQIISHKNTAMPVPIGKNDDSDDDDLGGWNN